MAALKRSRDRHDERGAVLVEAAIALPLLLLVVLGIIDFGRLFQSYEVLTNAAREGARLAVLPGGYTTGDVQSRVNIYLQAGGLDPALATATPANENVELPGGGPCIALRGVTVTYPHTFSFVGGIVGLFGPSSFGTTTLTATARMRSEAGAVACPVNAAH